MPVNEINAPSYCVIRYRNIDVNKIHSFRIYFDATATPDGLTFRFTTYTDGTHATGWTLFEIIAEFWDRAKVLSSTPEYQILDVAYWESEAGANTFVGFDSSDYSGVGFGTVDAIASAYLMAVFQTATRDNVKYTWLDHGQVAPQRFPVNQPPTTDNDSFVWFIIRSAVGFANNDGLPITRVLSLNEGYNRLLARKYGRELIP